MKKIYTILGAALMLFVATEINAQITHEVRFDLDGIEGPEAFDAEVGDSIHFRVGSGLDRTVSAVGDVPGFQETTIEEGEPGFGYTFVAANVHVFEVENTLGLDTREIRVNVRPDGSISAYDIQVGNDGFDRGEFTIELGDTARIRVMGEINYLISSVDTQGDSWTFADSLLVKGDTGIFYVPMAVGVYTFRAMTTGETAVSTTTTVTVVPNSQPDGPTSTMESVAYEGISIAPNPVKDELYLSLNNSYAYNVSISNMTGNTVMSTNVSNGSNSVINVASLPKGVYVLHLMNSTASQPKAFKFVKE